MATWRGNTARPGQPVSNLRPEHSSERNDRVLRPVHKSKIIGYYSVDRDRAFFNDSSKLMYYNPQKNMKVFLNLSRGVHLDLDEGADVAVCRSPSFLHEGINLLLKWIMQNHHKISAPPNSNKWIRPKFVSSRGTIGRLLQSKNLRTETWIICAAKWQGTIYLCTDKRKNDFSNKYNSAVRFGSWGHKFEQYILSKSPDKLPDTSKPVIETEEFRCVFERNIGGHSVLYCSIMKGVVSETELKDPLPLNKLKFIELKTSRIVENVHHERILKRFKMLKWWTTCYLTNIDEVLCDYRDQSGVVNKLSLHNVDKIVEEGAPYWRPGHVINNGKSFLTMIEETVVHDCNEKVYRFEKGANGEIDVSEFPASSEYAFLPSWFLETV